MAQQTTRQKQSTKILREREQRMKRRLVRRWVAGGACALVLAGLASGGIWIKEQQIVEKTSDMVAQSFMQATRDAGLRVRNIYIQGRQKTDQAQVLEALGTGLGGPLLEVSLEDARARLEAISTVHHASVERVFPDTLKVTLQERQPVAIWQYKQQLQLVDAEGKVLEGEDPKSYPKLMVVVGEGAPSHAKALMDALAKQPEIEKNVAAAVRIGDRRWNLKMNGGVSVMLPEDGEADALQKLVKMQQEQSILQKSITAIDMRLQERIFIKLTPESMQRRLPDAKKPQGQGPRTET